MSSRRRINFLHQWNQSRFQLRKKFINHLRGKTRIVQFNRVIVGTVTPPLVVGLAFGQFQMLLDERRIGRKLAIRAGLRPSMVSRTAMARLLLHKLRREFRHAVKISARLAHHDLLIGIELIHARLELLEPFADTSITRRGVFESRDSRHLLGAKVRTLRREVYLFIPSQQALHRTDQMAVFKSFNQVEVSVIHKSTICPPSSLLPFPSATFQLFGLNSAPK